MPLPRGDEYFEAVQNPIIAFCDADLRVCWPEKDLLGTPKPYSGGFTITFHLENHSQHWAVRCFTRAIPDLQKRYEVIGKFLQNTSDKFFVKTSCLYQGIRVNGQWYPIIKMQWIDGENLNTFISNNISKPKIINSLIEEFRKLINRLEKLGVAHGDLQHGNILVKQGKLYLIDYDGFFHPELSNLKVNEIGHPNYQHPSRTAAHYDNKIDRFSAIVIYLGLRAVVALPSLWERYDNGENILFCSSDFINPESSKLLKDIAKINELAPLADKFKQVCRLDYDNIPSLEQFINNKINGSEKKIGEYSPKSPYEVIDAFDSEALSKHIGRRVVVTGLIKGHHSSKTKYGNPYLFLNFSNFYPNHTFTLVFWHTTLEVFKSRGIDPLSYLNKRIKATGVITTYHNKPQMTIENPSQIEVLSGEKETERPSSSSEPNPGKPWWEELFDGSDDDDNDKLSGRSEPNTKPWWEEVFDNNDKDSSNNFESQSGKPWWEKLFHDLDDDDDT
mgnify:CR=1 FL=1